MRLTISVILAICFPVACLSCRGDSCDKLQGWLSDLSKGIRSVKINHGTYRLVIYKKDAYALAFGKNDLDVVLTAAELGKGRLIVSGSPSYIQDISGKENAKSLRALHINLKNWVSKEKYKNSKNICHIQNSDSLANCVGNPSVKIIVFTGGFWPTEADNNQLLTWVENGGGLIYAMDTDSVNSQGLSVLSYGFYNILMKAGITYTPQKIKGKSFKLESDKKTVKKLLGINVEEVASKVTKRNWRGNKMLNFLLDSVKNEQKFFPLEISQEILRPFESFAKSIELAEYPAGTFNDEDNTIPNNKETFETLQFLSTLGYANLWKSKAPNVDKFPGDSPSAPVVESGILHFNSTSNKDAFSTGYYLMPGKMMTITVLNAEEDESWTDYKLKIGIHNGVLKKYSDIARWPEIKRYVDLTRRETKVQWMFGGLLSVIPPTVAGKQLQIKLSGVCETPYLDITDKKSIAKWNRRRQAPGLWADIRGKYMRFSFQSQGVRHLDNPIKIMQRWDTFVSQTYELLGYPKSRWRSQWAIAELQLNAAMHSGFPIVGHLNKGDPENPGFFLSGQWEDHWGMYHEFGHNVNNQRWTGPMRKEVTNNIFSLFGMDLMAKQSWPNDKLTEIIRKNLPDFLANPDYKNMKTKVRLLVYSQFIRDFGWGCQSEVFKQYTEDDLIKAPMPKDDASVVHLWVTRTSKAVGYNLCPMYQFWNWPVQSSTCKPLSGMTPYLPDDEITRRSDAKQLLKKVLREYPDVTRKVDNKTKCTEFKLKYE